MKRSLWLLLIWVITALPGMAAGLIIVHDSDFWRYPNPPPVVPGPPGTYPPPRLPPTFPRSVPPQPAWAPLEVSFIKADVKIRNQIAVAAIEQEFYNPNSRQLEGTFLFPVPKGAQIDKFTMEINGKPVEAELLASEKARGIYEDIVRRLKDPALLEYAGRDLFKVRIFPIEPNSKKRITLSYTQLLKSDAGLVNFLLPLNTEKFSAKPLRSVSVNVDVETKSALKSIYSPSHKIEVKRHGENNATIGYEAGDLKPDADFQLFYTQQESDLGLTLLSYKTGEDEGYFALLASPGATGKSNRILPKDVVFVLDTSGSMAGAKLEQARKALGFCVENLNDHDRFEILRFATEVEPFFDKLADASPENRASAQKFIAGLKPIGGTAINDAMKKALALRPAKVERPYVVIFLTDGRPTVGDTAEDHIVSNVTSSKDVLTRVFCFGMGTDVNTHLLDRIAEESKAFSQYVLPEEDIEVKVSAFFTKIKEPVLANPKITFPESVRVTKLYPSPLPDLYKGEQIVLAGRYSGKGEGAIEIQGSVDGETKKFAYDVKFPGDARDHEFIPRLWATRRVGYLLDEIRLRGESKELKDEVSELARKFNIVTPYTAYLIMEDEGRRGVAQGQRSVWFEDRDARRGLAMSFDSFSHQKEGEQAVGGARSSFSLKSADAPADAISLGRVEAFKGEAKALKMQRTPLGNLGSAAQMRLPVSAPEASSLAKARSDEYAQQSRFIKGRTFYQNGAQWVDSEVQKLPDAKRVRIQFASTEYFDLLKNHPETQEWLSTGRSVQLVVNGTIYEIYE